MGLIVGLVLLCCCCFGCGVFLFLRQRKKNKRKTLYSASGNIAVVGAGGRKEGDSDADGSGNGHGGSPQAENGESLVPPPREKAVGVAAPADEAAGNTAEHPPEQERKLLPPHPMAFLHVSVNEEKEDLDLDAQEWPGSPSPDAADDAGAAELPRGVSLQAWAGPAGRLDTGSGDPASGDAHRSVGETDRLEPDGDEGPAGMLLKGHGGNEEDNEGGPDHAELKQRVSGGDSDTADGGAGCGDPPAATGGWAPLQAGSGSPPEIAFGSEWRRPANGADGDAGGGDGPRPRTSGNAPSASGSDAGGQEAGHEEAAAPSASRTEGGDGSTATSEGRRSIASGDSEPDDFPSRQSGNGPSASLLEEVARIQREAQLAESAPSSTTPPPSPGRKTKVQLTKEVLLARASGQTPPSIDGDEDEYDVSRGTGAGAGAAVLPGGWRPPPVAGRRGAVMSVGDSTEAGDAEPGERRIPRLSLGSEAAADAAGAGRSSGSGRPQGVTVPDVLESEPSAGLSTRALLLEQFSSSELGKDLARSSRQRGRAVGAAPASPSRMGPARSPGPRAFDGSEASPGAGERDGSGQVIDEESIRRLRAERFQSKRSASAAARGWGAGPGLSQEVSAEGSAHSASHPSPRDGPGSSSGKSPREYLRANSGTGGASTVYRVDPSLLVSGSSRHESSEAHPGGWDGSEGDPKEHRPGVQEGRGVSPWRSRDDNGSGAGAEGGHGSGSLLEASASRRDLLFRAVSTSGAGWERREDGAWVRKQAAAGASNALDAPPPGVTTPRGTPGGSGSGIAAPGAPHAGVGAHGTPPSASPLAHRPAWQRGQPLPLSSAGLLSPRGAGFQRGGPTLGGPGLLPYERPGVPGGRSPLDWERSLPAGGGLVAKSPRTHSSFNGSPKAIRSERFSDDYDKRAMRSWTKPTLRPQRDTVADPSVVPIIPAGVRIPQPFRPRCLAATPVSSLTLTRDLPCGLLRSVAACP